jgi:hypothetical protein
MAKSTKWQKVPNGNKIYQMAVNIANGNKYTKWQ